MTPTIIAHISDLHLARRPPLAQINVKRLLGYVNYALSRRPRFRKGVAEAALRRIAEFKPDLLVVSGDLSQLGLDDEFLDARKLLLGVKKAGIPVLIAPGNHDCYAGFHPEALAGLRDEFALGLRPDGHGIHHLPGVEIAILDQGIPTPPFASYGRTEKGALKRIAAAWSNPPSGASRVVCGHFPASARRGLRPRPLHGLLDWRELRSFLRGCRVSAYLCGHDHKRFQVELEGGCVQYAAPSLPVDGMADAYECDADGLRRKPPL